MENKPDHLAAISCLFRTRQFFEVLTKHAAVAGFSVENPRDDGDQRRLSATGRADEHHELADFHVEVDAAKGEDLRAAGAVRFDDVVAAHREIGRPIGLNFGVFFDIGGRRFTVINP